MTKRKLDIVRAALALAAPALLCACEPALPAEKASPAPPTLSLQIGTAGFDANTDFTKATLVPGEGMGLVTSAFRTFIIDLHSGADLRAVTLSAPGNELKASAWASALRHVYAIETDGETLGLIGIDLATGAIVEQIALPEPMKPEDPSPDVHLASMTGTELIVVVDGNYAVFDAAKKTFSEVREAPIKESGWYDRRVTGCPDLSIAVFYEIGGKVEVGPATPDDIGAVSGIHVVQASGGSSPLHFELGPGLPPYRDGVVEGFACAGGEVAVTLRQGDTDAYSVMRGPASGTKARLQRVTQVRFPEKAVAAFALANDRVAAVSHRGNMLIASPPAQDITIDLDARDPTNIWLRRQNMDTGDRDDRYDHKDVWITDLGRDKIGILFSGGYAVLDAARNELVAKAELQAPLGAITRFRLGLRDRAVFLNQFGVATLADLRTGQVAQADRAWTKSFEESFVFSQPIDVAGDAGVAVFGLTDGKVMGLDLRGATTNLLQTEGSADTLCVAEDLSRIVVGVIGENLDDRVLVYSRRSDGFVLEATSRMRFKDISELVCDDRAETFILWDSLAEIELMVFSYAAGEIHLLGEAEGSGGALLLSRDGRWFDTGQKLYSVDLEKRRIEQQYRPDGTAAVVFDPVDGPRFLSSDGGWLGIPRAKTLSPAAAGRQIVAADILTNGRIVALADDLVTRIYDPAAPDLELLKLVWFREGGWAAIDRLGRFDASDLDRLPLLHWVFPDEPGRGWSPELFVREFFEPDLIRRTLENEISEAGPLLASIERRARPDVRIVSVEMSSPSRASVTVEVRSPEGSMAKLPAEQRDAYDLRLLRDGRLVGRYPEDAGTGADGRIDLKDGVALIRFDDVPLPSSARPQEITFASYAFNSDRVKTSTASRSVLAPAPTGTPLPSAHIVAVGVNDYLAEGLDLNFAVADAELFGGAMRTSLIGTKQYASVTNRILAAPRGSVGAGAKKADVLAAIASLARRGKTPASPDDLVFIFFAGHGVNDASGAFYLLPSDFPAASFDKDGLWRVGAISGEELASAIQGIDAREIVLVIDACFSESSIADGRFKPAPLGDRGLGQIAYDKAMRILVSARANEAAIESGSIGHGLVTYALMQFGLKDSRADRIPEDSQITLGEWLSYVEDISNDQFASVVKDGWRFEATTRGVIVEPTQEEIFSELQQPRLFDFARRLGGPDPVIALARPPPPATRH